MRNYILTETNWKGVKQADFELAVLPWGATEAHNYHLPYGTDTIIAGRIAEEAALLATNRGGKVIVLPAIPYGVNTGQPDITLDMNLNPSTQLHILRDLITVLNRQGIFKLVILNAHGGNDFKQMIRELNLEFPQMFLCQCDWFKISGAPHYFEDMGEHAGEVETSFMQFLTPELVLPLHEAGDGRAKVFAVNALNKPWAWAERHWSEVTQDTGIGNPANATSEKGEAFFKFVVGQIGEFLYELTLADLSAMYRDK